MVHSAAARLLIGRGNSMCGAKHEAFPGIPGRVELSDCSEDTRVPRSDLSARALADLLKDREGRDANFAQSSLSNLGCSCSVFILIRYFHKFLYSHMVEQHVENENCWGISQPIKNVKQRWMD